MAINAAATVSTAEGIAKRVHGDVVNLVPSKIYKAQKRIPFDRQDMMGGSFAEEVWLTMEHGFTHAGSTGAKRTLNSSEVAESQLAEASPIETMFRSEVTMSLMSRAQSRGPKAFESYIAALMRNAKEAANKRTEIMLTRGGTPLAYTSSCTDVVTSSVITITTASWAPHIWLNMRNCPIEAYAGNTLLNTNADLFVTSVDTKNNKITVSGNATDIDTMVADGTFELYFKGVKNNGSSGTLDGTGLASIAALTSSSSDYLGISCANYTDVWNATQVTWDQSTEDFTWVTLSDGLEEAAGRGFFGDCIVQVPFNVWNTLNSSLDALRVLDSSFNINKSEMGRGVDSIVYHGITGSCIVEPSGFQPYGEVLVYPDSSEDGTRARRIGSSDWTFDVPGRGGEMFRLTENANTVEYRMFTDQMLWLPAPRNVVKFGA